MQKGDTQLGSPQIVYKDTKANIEALTVVEGAIAYATDTNQFGSYNGVSWDWLAAAAGNDTEIQFNDGGVLAGNAGLTFNKTTGIVNIASGTYNLGGVPHTHSLTTGTSTVIGILPPANGGTGILNTGTFTNQSNTTITGGGTIALGGFTATIPATGTVMLGTVTDAYIPRSNAGILQAGAIRDNGSEIAIGTTINTAVQFTALRTSTATSSSALANNTVLFANPASNSSATYIGIQLSARTSAVVHNFTGSIQGGTFNTIHTGSGTLTNQYAGRFQTQSTGGGISTNAYAMQILASTISGVGSAITNNYGLYIGDIVGSTLSYSIYSGLGIVRHGDQLFVDLASDKIGFILQAHSTHTANVFEMQTSAAAVVNSMSLAAGTVLNEQGDAAIDLRAESDTEANMLFLDSSADALYFGGTTNGVKILKGGELSLIGTATVWDDLRISPDVKGTGSKDPTWSAWISGLYLYDFDNATAGSEKELWFNVQMPHGWKEGSSVYPHVHWVNDTAGTAGQVVRWGLEYTVAKIGATFPAVTTVYGTTIVGGGDITVADEHLITSFDPITMTGNTISTILVCRLFRNSSNAADTYGGTAGLLSIDWHYEVDKIGSSTEFA